MTSQVVDMTPSSNFFDVVLLLFSSLATGPSFKFHIITGSGVITIFFYKGLTRNPEIGNTPVWVLPNICRPKLGIPNLARMSLMKCYLMLAKC